LIKDFSGAIYKTATEPSTGCSERSVRIGKKAASVFPEAVEEARRRFSSLSKIACAAASWIERKLSQPCE